MKKTIQKILKTNMIIVFTMVMLLGMLPAQPVQASQKPNVKLVIKNECGKKYLPEDLMRQQFAIFWMQNGTNEVHVFDKNTKISIDYSKSSWKKEDVSVSILGFDVKNSKGSKYSIQKYFDFWVEYCEEDSYQDIRKYDNLKKSYSFPTMKQEEAKKICHYTMAVSDGFAGYTSLKKLEANGSPYRFDLYTIIVRNNKLGRSIYYSFVPKGSKAINYASKEIKFKGQDIIVAKGEHDGNELLNSDGKIDTQNLSFMIESKQKGKLSLQVVKEWDPWKKKWVSADIKMDKNGKLTVKKGTYGFHTFLITAEAKNGYSKTTRRFYIYF